MRGYVLFVGEKKIEVHKSLGIAMRRAQVLADAFGTPITVRACDYEKTRLEFVVQPKEEGRGA